MGDTKEHVVASKGADTRERILEAAQSLVLERGFAGVSVDQVIQSLNLTKGAFFHHFKNKADLATSLIQRYKSLDIEYFHVALARGEKLSDDPLQQILITIGLYQEQFGGLDKPYPGCLLASFVYEIRQFDEPIAQTINEVFLVWRKELETRFKRIAERYPPQQAVDLTSLADQFVVILEGAFILAKSLKDPEIVPRQLQHFKHYVELVFRPKE